MNEPRDPLETELASLLPVEISPEFRERLAARLADDPPSSSRRWWLPALCAGIAAACLAAAIFQW